MAWNEPSFVSKIELKNPQVTWEGARVPKSGNYVLKHPLRIRRGFISQSSRSRNFLVSSQPNSVFPRLFQTFFHSLFQSRYLDCVTQVSSRVFNVLPCWPRCLTAWLVWMQLTSTNMWFVLCSALPTNPIRCASLLVMELPASSPC